MLEAGLLGHPGLGKWRGPATCSCHSGSTSLGCVEFLSRPTMAFVRLREAVELDAVLEVPVPVRFLFLLLGPSSANMDYHEIGRSISTLMSDKVSCLPVLLTAPATYLVQPQFPASAPLLYAP